MNKDSPAPYVWVVVMAAMGYFVDIFDLILFGIVRVQSLADMGLSPHEITTVGMDILNAQMLGMLLGGLLWGALGDKLGRVKVLIGAIMMYSLANIATGFVQTVEQYKILRFLGGIGLAGELGAGVTLAIESMPKKIRGMGASIIAGFGVLGAALAEVVVHYLPWRDAYILGGVMGLVVMVLRLRLHESDMFIKHKMDQVDHGNFLALISRRDLLIKYICCITVGVPVWFTIGLLVYFSPEFAKELGVNGQITAGRAIMYTYLGLAVGDISSGLLSQFYNSRRKALGVYIFILLLTCILYSQASGVSASQFYGIMFVTGIAAGYWSLMVINASEQFGVNFRATAATSVPNFVRGAVVPMTLAFAALRESNSMIISAGIIGVVVFSLALLAVYYLPETFDKDLNQVE